MKRMMQFTLCAVLIISLLSTQFNSFSYSFFSEPNGIIGIDSTPVRKVKKQDDSWIVKWKNGVHPDFLKTSHIISDLDKVGAYVVRPSSRDQLTEWLERWSSDPGLEYFYHNQKIETLVTPNDELFNDQNYLQQIHANEAWDISTENKSITIAIIDTGIDLEHPDLKDNLIPGVNLLQYGQSPQDDHGHGTSVAGVIAAIGNNQIGVSGLLWNAGIMPVKALDEEGEGKEDKLGEGILYAVDNGAKIIVLSVGLVRFSPLLEEVSEYAESKGVLLIAAAGNEGNVIKYPAAYPSVFAVGAVGSDNRVMLESNYGSEIDIAAPWRVYTTALGGGYQYNQGTSMSAPQVAGVAALLWSKYPDMQPFEIRNQLRQTAEDIESNGWDPYSGYGLLRADRALKETYKVDMYEPNDISDTARKMPLDTMIIGELNKGTDQDWFYMDPPYRGSVELTFQFAGANGGEGVVITHYSSNQDKGTVYTSVEKQKIVIPVTNSRSRFQIKFTNPNTATIASYQLTTALQIYRDDFEDNDRQYKAYTIAAEKQALIGTFHQVNDQDWFSIEVKRIGTLSVSIFPDTVRMDVGILIQKYSEKPFLVDLSGEGVEETIGSYEVSTGRYYILVSNVISDVSYPVIGEYELEIDFSPKLIDPNEPNDKYFAATSVGFSTDYEGLIDPISDLDMFMFTLTQESIVVMQVRDIPDNAIMLMTLLDQKQTQLQVNMNTLGQRELSIRRVLPKGTYYAKLGADQAFQNTMYRFGVRAEALIAGFQDIRGHWAEKNITSLVKQSILSGYGDYTFRPERFISRSEAVALISKAYGLKTSTNISFTDVSPVHWAYESIRKAVGVDIITGYSDNSFRPDQPVTRGEMSVMIAKALKMQVIQTTSTYTDVSANHWAAPWIYQLQSKNYIQGYGDGTFRPEGGATRAEFATILLRALAI